MIDHHCRYGQEERLEGLLLELRQEVMLQPGYLSGETLQSVGDPTHWTMASTWINEDQWAAWQENPKRNELTSKIEPLLRASEEVEIYHFKASGISAPAYALVR
jgi:quinol monooxygenase YgiN